MNTLLATLTRTHAHTHAHTRTHTHTQGAVVGGAGEHFNHDAQRSNMFTFVQCSDVVVSDLTVRNSSAWTLVPIFSQRVSFKRLHISQGPGHHSNTDGFDPLGTPLTL